MGTLYDYASVLRSKNAGPLYLTFDIMFPDKETYEKVKNSGCVNPKKVAELYGCSVEKVQVYNYDTVDAIKVTIPRHIVNGSLGEDDVYGAQQHVPIANIVID